jgi:hypothetical protein
VISVNKAAIGSIRLGQPSINVGPQPAASSTGTHAGGALPIKVYRMPEQCVYEKRRQCSLCRTGHLPAAPRSRRVRSCNHTLVVDSFEKLNYFKPRGRSRTSLSISLGMTRVGSSSISFSILSETPDTYFPSFQGYELGDRRPHRCHRLTYEAHNS